MSLINEALKRTEAARRSRAGGQSTLPEMIPPPDGSSGAPARRTLGRDVRSILLTVGVLAVVVFSGLWAIDPGASLLSWRVSSASAAESADPLDAVLPDSDARGVKQPAAFARAVSDAQADRRQRPESVPHDRAPDLPLAAAAAEPHRPAQGPPPAGGAEAPRPPAPEQARPKAQPQPPAPAPAPQADQPTYRLTGIVTGREGPVAIINGLFLREGQKVSRAKVLRIGQHTVVLEIDGVSVTIRM